MFPIFDLLPVMFKSFLSVFEQATFWILILIVGLLYRKMALSSHYLFGTLGESPWRLTFMSIFFGVLGGFLGSYLLIIVGISLNEVGGINLLFTALGLMLIQMRFLCFAYAGGVLALSKLLFGFPQVNVAQVMALVAVLHLVEALLIYLTGSIAPIPVCLRTKEGRLVGAYNLQKFWPLPLVVLIAGQDPYVVRGLISMPDWWPLVKSEFSAAGGEFVYSLLALPAVLGYGDIAMTTSPQEKTRRAAWELAGYSLILLCLAVGASHNLLVAYLAALFGPLGHEFIIQIGIRRENKGKPIFVAASSGIKLLYVQRKSPLAKAGVQAGDLLFKLNGNPVNSQYEARKILLAGIAEGKWEYSLEYLQVKTGKTRKTLVRCREGEQLGYIPVPQWYSGSYMEVTTSVSLLKNGWRKLKRLFKRQ